MMKKIPFMYCIWLLILAIPSLGTSEPVVYHVYDGIDFTMEIDTLEAWLMANASGPADISIYTEGTFSHLICKGTLPFGDQTVCYFGAGYFDGVLRSYYLSVEEANMPGVPLSDSEFAARYKHALDHFMTLRHVLEKEYGGIDRIVLWQDGRRQVLSAKESMGFDTIDAIFSQASRATISIQMDNVILKYSKHIEENAKQPALVLVTGVHFHGPSNTADLFEFM